jgi:hypothetical protein
MSGPATMPAGQRILTLAPKGYCSTDPEDHPSLPTQTTGRLDRQLLNRHWRFDLFVLSGGPTVRSQVSNRLLQGKKSDERSSGTATPRLHSPIDPLTRGVQCHRLNGRGTASLGCTCSASDRAVDVNSPSARRGIRKRYGEGSKRSWTKLPRKEHMKPLIAMAAVSSSVL